MAKKYDNDKGFLIIEMSVDEATINCGFSIICDKNAVISKVEGISGSLSVYGTGIITTAETTNTYTYRFTFTKPKTINITLLT